MGPAKVLGGPDDFKGVNIRSKTGETLGDGRAGKKAGGILCVEGVLYLWVRNADRKGHHCQLAWSRDHVRTCPSGRLKHNRLGRAQPRQADDAAAARGAHRQVLARVQRPRGAHLRIADEHPHPAQGRYLREGPDGAAIVQQVHQQAPGRGPDEHLPAPVQAVGFHYRRVVPPQGVHDHLPMLVEAEGVVVLEEIHGKVDGPPAAAAFFQGGRGGADGWEVVVSPSQGLVEAGEGSPAGLFEAVCPRRPRQRRWPDAPEQPSPPTGDVVDIRLGCGYLGARHAAQQGAQALDVVGRGVLVQRGEGIVGQERPAGLHEPLQRRQGVLGQGHYGRGDHHLDAAEGPGRIPFGQEAEPHSAARQQRVGALKGGLMVAAEPGRGLARGFGLGVERMVMWVCKLEHIRDAIAFPRLARRQPELMSLSGSTPSAWQSSRVSGLRSTSRSQTSTSLPDA